MALVAVTGGTGLLGHALLPRLLSRGHQLRLLTRRTRVGESRAEIPGVTWHEGSLADGASLDALTDGVDCILHAAYSEPGSTTMPGSSATQSWLAENFNGTMRLLERTVATGKRQLLYTSSLAVFSRDPNLDPRGDRFVRDEDSPLAPLEFYGSLRAACESLLRTAAHAYGLNTSIWRLGLVLGLRDPWTSSPFAQQAREAASHSEVRTPYGAYTVAVEDAAEILADAVGDEGVRGQTFHVFDRWVTHSDVAPRLGEALGKPVRVTCEDATEPRLPVLGTRIRARYANWTTDKRLASLAQQLVECLRA